MANTNRQYKDSAKFTFGGIIGIILLVFLMLLTSCYGTYYISDAEYSNIREEHSSITYWRDFDGCFFGTGLVGESPIYWGWSDGFYYYYGQPHYYPWYYYYNTCPPSIYNSYTHIIVNKPVTIPTHRPNIPTHRSNTIIKNNTKTKPKSNINRNNKIIIKTNNGSKRTNKTTIRRKPKN